MHFDVTDFEEVAQFYKHRRTHTGERSYLCSYCGKIFTKKDLFQRHVLKEMQDANLLTHKCDLCSKHFLNLTSLKKHKAYHGERKNLCGVCRIGFCTLHLLQKHSQTHHSDLKKQREKRFLCSDCGKGFTTKNTLLEHSNIHSGMKLCLYYLPVRYDNYRVHTLFPSGRRPFSCDICNKTFMTTAGLRCHSRIHSGKKPYVCNLCTKTFRQQQHLKNHLRTHSGERPCICSYCGKGFTTTGNLKVHVRTHTKETPHVCDLCGKGFYDSSSLKKHKVAHYKKNALLDDVKSE